MTLFNCPSCTTWVGLRDAIAARMPPAVGRLHPTDCVDACADRTADWIWAEVNGWTLTENGGTRPPTPVVNLRRDTRRIKSYASIRSDFERVFGQVPAFLEASAGAFEQVPAFWYRNHDLGAVTLNVLVNAAVQACEQETMPAFERSAIQNACRQWASRMWLREADSAELQSCVDTAMTITTDLGDPRKQLIFACASMMISIPSLTF